MYSAFEFRGLHFCGVIYGCKCESAFVTRDLVLKTTIFMFIIIFARHQRQFVCVYLFHRTFIYTDQIRAGLVN